MNWYKKSQQNNNWTDFPLRADIGESPNKKDVPPQRTPQGDFILYHGTSKENAEKIIQQRTLTHDDTGSVGFGTTPESVHTYSTHKGNPAILQITVSKDWLMNQDLRHEIGGHGNSAFVINPNFLLKQKAQIPPEAIKDIKIISGGIQMNWFKKAQQKYLWDDDPLLPMANTPRPEWETTGNLEEDIEESENQAQLQRALEANQIEYEEIIFPNNEKAWFFNQGNDVFIILLGFPYPRLERAKEWIEELGDHVFEYVDMGEFSKQYWDEIGNGSVVYHGTSEENVDSILKYGLTTEYKTRGISNRSTGAAIFTSETPEAGQDYYDVILEINVGQMKKDGYLVNVSKEEPVQEAEAKESLAWKLGIRDYFAEYEQGMDPGTVIFYGSIPPQYIKVYK